MDIWCKQCGMQGKAARPPETCSSCGAGVHVRLKPPPSPRSHFGKLLASLKNLGAIFAVAAYAVLHVFPIWQGRLLANGILIVGVIKFGRKAMQCSQDAVEFPEIDVSELFEGRWWRMMFVFGAVFVLAPVVLLGVAHLFESAMTMWLLRSLAVALAFYAPMAFVIMLQSNTAMGALFVWVGVRFILADLPGYLLLVAMFAAIFAGINVTVALNGLAFGPTYVVSILMTNALTAVGWLLLGGLCGLFVRKHARLLDLPIDDADWVFVSEAFGGRAPQGQSPSAPHAPDLPSSAPLDLGIDDGGTYGAPTSPVRAAAVEPLDVGLDGGGYGVAAPQFASPAPAVIEPEPRAPPSVSSDMFAPAGGFIGDDAPGSPDAPPAMLSAEQIFDFGAPDEPLPVVGGVLLDDADG